MLRDPEARLRCPFGVDWLDQFGGGSRLDRAHRIPYWLSLMEMHGDGYRYGIQSDRHLPYVFDKLLESLKQSRLARQQAPRGASEHLICVPDDLERALANNPVFRDKIATHDLLTYALKEAPKYLAMIATQQLQRGSECLSSASLMPPEAAKVIAHAFFDFALKNSLAHVMQELTSEQIQVTALFLSKLLQKPPKRIYISERFDLLQVKPTYVPSEAVSSPPIPHFVKVAAEHGPPTLQAPFICQLCGDGFVTMSDLWKHAGAQHHSWAEYRKRLIFEVQQCKTVPLQPIEKRRLAGNFYRDLLYSRPARNTLREDRVTVRQVVACATCAIKDWIDDFYPCYVWKEAPPDVVAGAAEHDEQDDEADHDGEAPKEHVSGKSASGPSLRDEDGFCYLGPVDQIDALLNVNHYRHVVPLAPLEELHASSVQHPRYPQMRWLMHTRRVPVLQPDHADEHAEDATVDNDIAAPQIASNAQGQSGASEHACSNADDARPACAGIGNAEVPCWLCHHCAAHLCMPTPRMPP